ncbi:MAG: radical SAM protein [Acidimicrobiales bacterium]
MPPTSPTDTLDRPVKDLRISVTDRCTYCMPKEIFNSDYRYLQRAALLTFEEIERVARSFPRHGVTKLRLTGGEPLLRHGIEELVARLAAIPEIDDLALTTNGALLGRMATDLAVAGLHLATID